MLVAACEAKAPRAECQAAAADCPDPVADPVDPMVHIGRATGPTFIEIVDLEVVGDVVYGCTGTKGLTVWDASGDDAPGLIVDQLAPGASLSDPQFPRCQHIGYDPESDTLVITNRGDEIQPQPWLWRYDVSNPADPRPLGGWSPALSVEGVAVDGERTFVALHTAGVTVVRPAGGGALQAVGNYADDDSDAWVPLLVGDTLLVAEGATGLRTYDVSTDEPQLLATLPLSGSSRDVVAEDGRAYVASSGGLAIVDISDPAAPSLLGETAVDGTLLEVALGPDDTVLTAEWDEVRGYDVSDPSNIVARMAETVPTDVEFSRVLAVATDPSRRRVYAGEWRGMHAFDQVQGGRGPELFVSPSVLQFGTLSKGESDERVVVLRNRGDQPLTIGDIAGAGGVSANTTCMQIPPGGAEAIEVTMESDANQFIEAQLAICSDDPDETERRLRATANVPGRDIGDEVPDFDLFDTTGERWTPAQLEGRVAVLAYFATF